MCNLYSQTTNREAMLRLFRISPNRAAAFEPQDGIFPGYQAPIIRVAGDGERELVLMHWGFPLLMKGYAPRRVTNFRDDSARSSGMWRQSFEQRRCLVPATSFCEPNDGRAKGEKDTWHWFALKGEESRPVYAFAGIWRSYTGPIKKDGPNITQDVYSFLTTDPNAATISINHERSPVILASEADQQTWLHGTVDEAHALARPYDAERMHIVQASYEKRDLLGAAP
jgi:putative SOS response-associated peptidase YedK